jgi:hypothetical protein
MLFPDEGTKDRASALLIIFLIPQFSACAIASAHTTALAPTNAAVSGSNGSIIFLAPLRPAVIGDTCAKKAFVSQGIAGAAIRDSLEEIIVRFQQIAVFRNDRGDRGNVGIIRSPVRASILPDHSPGAVSWAVKGGGRPSI